MFQITGEKLTWFQSQLDPNKTCYTKKDACEIIERYRTACGALRGDEKS